MEKTQRLQEALGLYEGPLLPGRYEDWAIVEQRRLAEVHMGATSALVGLLARAGETEQALQYAHSALAADPLREEAHQLVIGLLLADGRVGPARQHYDDMAAMLREELGSEPSAGSDALLERIRAAQRPPAVASRAGPATPQTPPDDDGASPPAGTVTFLLTDIEGSTRRAESQGARFAEAVELHHRLLRQVFADHDGHEVRELGDGFLAAFEHATGAVAAAVAAQRALQGDGWPTSVPPLSVRMAVLTGEVELGPDGYRGIALSEASRLLSAGHGGQVLCSGVTAGLVRGRIHQGVDLVDLGTYRLRDISQPRRVFQLSFPGVRQRSFPGLRAEPGHVASLPIVVTRFIGREDEVEHLRALLTEPGCQLVTLTGPGGSGKTRLAVEAARRLADDLRGAVWFVPLEQVSAPSLVDGALADAMQLPRSGHADPLAQAAQVLARQPSLVVLGNAEQVIDEVAELAQALMARAPDLKVIVTSRRRLNVQAEREFTVLPLALPEPGPAAAEADGAPQRLEGHCQHQRPLNRGHSNG